MIKRIILIVIAVMALILAWGLFAQDKVLSASSHDAFFENLAALCGQAFEADNEVVISGVIRDFAGHGVAGASVQLKGADFKTLFETKTDAEGKYSLQANKGTYKSMLAMRMEEYPSQENKLPFAQQRLEAWAWNVQADRDLMIDLRYHRLEVYGVNVFMVPGAAPGCMIYCRPMSLTRVADLMQGKAVKICPEPDKAQIEIEVNGKRSVINQVQLLKEYAGEMELYGYLIHASLPEGYMTSVSNLFRVIIKDLENGDTGEAVYFSTPIEYK